jgi:hypothetical protein
MRFHWFHLMPYPFLPEDFQQKYRSVWVDVPSTLYDPEKGHWLYNQYQALPMPQAIAPRPRCARGLYRRLAGPRVCCAPSSPGRILSSMVL